MFGIKEGGRRRRNGKEEGRQNKDRYEEETG